MKKNLTKAESLQFLSKYQKFLNIEIPDFFFIDKNNFKLKENLILKKIQKKFKKKKIIIRSSSLQEDKENQSNAGKFKSFGNIYYNNKNKIKEKIYEIIDEFDNPKDQILIQEFIDKPKVSGVIFTRDIKKNSPYLTINYDQSGRTDLITSGKINPTMKTLTIFKKNLKDFNFFGKNLLFLNKIQNLYNQDRLDIEFCIKGKKIFIFQCRPLKKSKKINDLEIQETLINIEKKFKKLNTEAPSVHGKFTLFSNMSDWNPAEMIGSKPHTLASSLYSELITDYVWSKQRHDYGYKNVEPNRLMVNLAGTTYIDVRTDFNSFLPEKLPDKIQKKAINYYLKTLKKFTYNHDKIEFEVVETCYDFNSGQKLLKFLNKKDASIYLKSLKEITNNILDKKKDIINKEIQKIYKLNKKIELLRRKKLSELQTIFFLINDCKKYGTLPFAGLARIAFIYTKLIKTLVEKNILSQQDFENFYESCETITKDMNNQLYKLGKDKDKKEIFLNKFGHLRPSTYSINSKNYKENFSKYFNNLDLVKSKKTKGFNLSKSQNLRIDKILIKHGLKTNTKNFFSEAKKSIQLREYSKFIFSKSINEIFVNLIKLSKEIKIPREDLEYLSIKNLINYYSNLNSKKLKAILIDEINKNKKEEKVMNLLNMPDFLSGTKDLYIQKDNIKVANYITENIVVGNILEIKNIKDYSKLDNKIVLLKNADPGYDFIFSRKLKGLITCYGGANSHMSIRCLELDIPAIIGVGSKGYNQISNLNSIEINCKQKFYKKIN